MKARNSALKQLREMRARKFRPKAAVARGGQGSLDALLPF